jgi:protein AFG1
MMMINKRMITSLKSYHKPNLLFSSLFAWWWRSTKSTTTTLQANHIKYLSSSNNSTTTIYDVISQNSNLKHDNTQLQLAKILDSLVSNSNKYLIETTNQQISKIPKGIYIYGSVGTGKTMLADLFYSTLIQKLSNSNNTLKNQVKRIHFHDFIRQVHRRIHHERQLNVKMSGLEAIINVADTLSKEAGVYIIDEFFISDVAEMFTITPLLTEMLRPSQQTQQTQQRRSVILVITSNTSPQNLAKGLDNVYDTFQNVFVTPILLKHVRVYEMTNNQDYRSLGQNTTITTSNNNNNFIISSNPDETGQQLSHSRCNNSKETLSHPVQLSTTFGRKLLIDQSWINTTNHQPECLVHFQWLCGYSLPALGVGDYASMCDYFSTIIITDVPEMRPIHFGKDGDSYRRFALFLDIAYDRRTNVIVISKASMLFNPAVNKEDNDEELLKEWITETLQNEDNNTIQAPAEESKGGRWASDLPSFRPEQAMKVSQLAAFRRAESRWKEMSRGIVRK